MIIYSDFFVPARFGGVNYGPISFIRTKYKDDVGLSAHENTHQKQFWASPFTFPFKYCFSKKWKLAYEAEAYKVQLTFSKNKASDIQLFASFLVNNYNLGITLEQAVSTLTG